MPSRKLRAYCEYWNVLYILCGLVFSLTILMWLIEERLSFLPYICCCIYNATEESTIYLKLTQELDDTVVGVQFRQLL